MGNPLMGAAPSPTMAGPAQPAQPAQPPQQASPEDLAKGHQFADHFLEALMALVAKPQGQLSKQDVFQSAAGLLGKGLFSDPQSKSGLVRQLTQLPEAEPELRAALGQEIMQLANFKQGLDAHAAQFAPPQGATAPDAAP